MTKLNILFMTEDSSNTVCINHHHYLEQAIAKRAECRWAGPGHKRHVPHRLLTRTVKRVMRDANWVFYYDFGVTKRQRLFYIPPRQERQYRVVSYIGDIQRNPPEYLKHLNNYGYDALLMAYTQTRRSLISTRRKGYAALHTLEPISPLHYTDGLNIPFLHTMPSINIKAFKPVDAPKIYDVTFIGALNELAYPLREDIWNKLPKLVKKHGWNALIRQGPVGPSLDRRISELQEEHFVGNKYARALALSKIFIFGTSIFKYPLFKFVEAMACKTCVMADIPLTAKELHFIPDWNFVAINRKNWREKLKYYLEHDDEREEIAQRGYETVLKYHTTDIRAGEIIGFLRRGT